MNFGRGWLFLLPLLAFVATAMLLSCGGNSGCGSSYNQFGELVSGSGTCVNGPGITPAPPSGSITSVTICQGAPPPPTPLPTATATTATPTIAPTPCPSFTATAVPENCDIQLHAEATFSNNVVVDVTNDTTTNWTSYNPSELTPLTDIPGVYEPIVSMGPTVNVEATLPGGIVSQSVAVTIGPPGACPPIIVLPTPPAPTPSG